jgi:hypothetical protein
MPQHELWAHDGSGVTVDPVREVEQLAESVADGAVVLADELDRQRKIITALLCHAGRLDICRGPNCGQDVWFVYHVHTKRWTPYNADGTNHFGTCPDRGKFRTSPTRSEKHEPPQNG